MFELREVLALAHPRERVFPLLLDPTRHGAWMPGFVGAELLTGQPGEVGATYRLTRILFGREASEVFELVGVEAPVAIEWRVDGSQGSSKRGIYTYAYRLGNVGERCALHLELTVRGMGLLGALLQPVMKRSMRNAMLADADAFAAFLDREF